MVEGTCLESKRTGNRTEGSNPSLSAVNGGEEEANCLASVRDEKDGAMFREYAKPRAGVEKFFVRRRKKYS